MDSSSLINAKRKKRSREFFPRCSSFPLREAQPANGISSTNSKPLSHFGYLQEGCVLVEDEESMKALYTKGFFGKGTLSKGGPKICFPHNDSSLEESESNKSNSSEESSSDSEIEVNENSKRTKRKSLRPHKVKRVEKSNKEKLQLTFEESFFLSYGLGSLVVLQDDKPLDLLRLWHKLCDLTPNGRFPSNYTAYHHLRSKGWIVRSGIKYGTDLVIYKEGPPYYHSSYAVIVKTVAEKKLKEILPKDCLPESWTSLAAKHRVVSQVAKDLMILYVIRPDSMSENKIATPFCVSQFKIQEVLVKRWVSSEERQE